MQSAVPEHINKMWPVVNISKEAEFLNATMTLFFKEGEVGSGESVHKKAIISEVVIHSSGFVDLTQFVETPGFNKVYLKSLSAESIGEFRSKEPVIAERIEAIMGDVEILRDVLNRGGG